MNPLVAPEASNRNGRTALSVNLNKVALLRNARQLDLPSVTRAAVTVLEAGASGITVHPRPDQRHIRASDVHALAALLQRWPHAELNIEGNPFHNLMDMVRAVRPQQCTFVPDSVEQGTSDHGWNAPDEIARLAPLIREAQGLGTRVSLFMDAVPDSMRLASEVGADRVELYTEPYARTHGTSAERDVLRQFAAAACAAQALGLSVNAGHDLNLRNLSDFLAAVPGVAEVSIGHALIADALDLGLAETVRRYLGAIQNAARTAHDAP